MNVRNRQPRSTIRAQSDKSLQREDKSPPLQIDILDRDAAPRRTSRADAHARGEDA